MLYSHHIVCLLIVRVNWVQHIESGHVEIMVMAMEMLECVLMEYQWNIDIENSLTSTCVLIVVSMLTFLSIE